MPQSLSTNQTIKTNTGDAVADKRLSQAFVLPATGLGGVQLMSATNFGSNTYQRINEDMNIWNPLEGPDDYDNGYKTRAISFMAKSGNVDPVLVDGDTMKLNMRPGTGFLLVSAYDYASQPAIIGTTTITLSGTGTDYYSGFWTVG